MKTVVTLVVTLFLLFTGEAFAQIKHKDNSGSLYREMKTPPQKLDSRLYFGSRILTNATSRTTQSAIVKYRLDSVIIEPLIPFESYIEGTAKGIYIYNDDGMMSSLVQYEWYEEWIPTWKEDHFFNDINQTSMIISSEFWENDGWVAFLKEDLSYYPDGSLKTHLYSDWNFNGWKESFKWEYTYSGNTVYETKYNKMDNVWYAEYVTEYIYNNNLLAQEISRSAGDNENIYQADYFYNNGDLSYKEIRYWIDNQWSIPLNKETCDYDDFNNIDLYSYLTWNEETSAWDINEQDQQDYNNEITYDELILPQFIEELFFNHMLTGQTVSYLYQGEIEDGYTVTPFYNEVIIEKAENIRTDVTQIHPNPVSDKATISWDGTTPVAHMEIYSLTGTLVKAMNIRNHSTISMDDLHEGIYMVLLRNDSTIIGYKKLIVN
jgi:hypothetical protein